jgi:hypothetical protein
MVEEINAFELLKEEMTTDEIHLRVNAIHRLKTVILSVGQSSTVSDLIPYLESKSLNNINQGRVDGGRGR